MLWGSKYFGFVFCFFFGDDSYFSLGYNVYVVRGYVYGDFNYIFVRFFWNRLMFGFWVLSGIFFTRKIGYVLYVFWGDRFLLFFLNFEGLNGRRFKLFYYVCRKC